MATQIPLQAVEDLLMAVAKSAVPLLTQTSQHILGAGGKRLRPRLVLLAHAAVNGTAPDDYLVPLAAAVEIIHTATLVHDDINDKGTLRRGRETVNSRWGGTFALLTGDFLFTKTYEIMAPYPNAINAALAKAALELVEGETLQIQAAKDGALDRDTYYNIIAKKTAALFVACAKLGALAGEASPEQIDALSAYAFNLGLAFQITDDILDLIADPEQLGKNAGIDLYQGRGLAAVQERHDGGNSRSGGNSHGVATATLPQDTAPTPLHDSLLAAHTLDAAVELGRTKARELIDHALTSLHTLPPSEARNDLEALAHLVINRDF